jgi:hypothetical protein
VLRALARVAQSSMLPIVKAKLRPIGLICIVLFLAFGALAFFSYRRLLAFENRFMPNLATLPTHHERRVSFRVVDLGSATRLPHWTVAYHEQPVTDTERIDPSITVDLFGRIADAASKDVSSAVESYQQERR